jgi:hypothetical protein
MTFALRGWPRGLFETGGGEPFLIYYVYGEFAELPTMRVDQYNSAGIPAGLDLQMYNRQQHAEVLNGFLGGYFGQFLQQKPDIDLPVRKARHCIVLKGQPRDATTLDYLRDCIGVLQYLIECGGQCVLDPQTLTWWRPSEWKEIFSSETIQPARHVTVIGSPEEKNALNGSVENSGAERSGSDEPGLIWLHTRGMKKFGRPDLSVHHVSETNRPSVMEMIERFINYQAFGGIIAEGEEIELESIAGTWRCSHHGSDEDPDFNNRHVLIELAN